MAKQKNRREEKLRKDLENTIANLDEAEETLTNDALPETERERIISKNEYRRDQIESLKENLQDRE